jgi:transposase
VAPLPHWSGASAGHLRTTRSGNRRLNAALHRIALVQIGIDGPGRAYYPSGAKPATRRFPQYLS